MAEGSVLDGASKEFREAVLGSNILGYMPVDFLAGRSEERADAVTNVAAAIQEQPAKHPFKGGLRGQALRS